MLISTQADALVEKLDFDVREKQASVRAKERDHELRETARKKEKKANLALEKVHYGNDEINSEIEI